MLLKIQLLVGLLVVTANSAVAHAQDLKFPYDALVAKADTEIRSGPGQLHYATEKMQPGATVKVYRIDPGNWAAIQPPSGSFSLIPASTVKLLDVETGEVLVEGTQAWVGTRLSAVEKPLWQVKLREGEEVDILGEVHWPSPEGHSVLWYQIAPPDGEFRWVKLDCLEQPVVANNENPETKKLEAKPFDIAKSKLDASSSFGNATTDELRIPATDQNSAIAQVDYETDATIASSAEPSKQPLLQESESKRSQSDGGEADNSGWRMARHRIDRKFPEPQLNADREQAAEKLRMDDRQPPRDRLASTQPNRFARDFARPNVDRNPNASAILATPEPLPPIGPLPNTQEANELRKFELMLAQQMGRPPLSWKFEEIKLKVEQVRARAQKSITRQYADRMLQKIKKCEQIRSRYRQAYNSDPAANTLLGNSPRDMPIGSGVDTTVQLGTTYDAYGWLKELKRDGGKLPPEFVLSDDNGKITHHIAGVPGLNLRRYLESKVGVIGRRGFHQQLNLDHVTVERIVELRKK